MNIITEDEKKGRIEDGIETILKLSSEDFEKVIERLKPDRNKVPQTETLGFYYLTDPCENPVHIEQIGLEQEYDQSGQYIGRGYFNGGVAPTMHQILEQVDAKSREFPEGTPENQRCKELLKQRDFESFLKLFEEEGNVAILSTIRKVLSEDLTFRKFLNYETHQQEFTVNGENVDIGTYLRIIAEFFGEKDESGNFKQDRQIMRDFYVPDLKVYQQRYDQILNFNRSERYTNPQYDFRQLDYLTEQVIRKEDEVDFKINPVLKQMVFGNMPEGLSIEEEAMYIYCKLYANLRYSDGYFNQNNIPQEQKNHPMVNQDVLEAIEPDSEVSSLDFARIFAKFLNDEVEGDIEAVVITEGFNEGKSRTGFFTKRISVAVDSLDEKTAGTNNFMRPQNGIDFEGVRIVADPDGIVPISIRKVFATATKKDPINIGDYVAQLKQIEQEEVPEDLQARLEAFTQTMLANDMEGKEAEKEFQDYYRAGFFQEDLEKEILGKRQIEEGRKTYHRTMAIRQKENNPGRSMYLLNFVTLGLVRCAKDEMLRMLQTGEYVYENDERMTQSIEVEGKEND